ncbi:AfsR/SARP family transcriptional regulator [Mycolicibacterium sarraceniae]|uniref:AfsR/SARP family transcriptional regulator n=1 Tax=Mycolicibacterium sarraceniae TaxID=1534348 RepID=UPI0013D554BF|nr:winged helix-turn-helix domain-containing protein [Mycolicibacterium sarraceniae]
MRAWRGAAPAELGGPRQRSLLARQFLAQGHVVSVDRLVEDLWHGEPPPKAFSALQAYVSHSRRVLEPDRARRGIAYSCAPMPSTGGVSTNRSARHHPSLTRSGGPTSS